MLIAPALDETWKFHHGNFVAEAASAAAWGRGSPFYSLESIQIMHLRIIFLVMALALSACATRPNQESEYNLGVYAYIAKDYATAREHWSRSLKRGPLSTHNNLGYLLYYGLGGPKDQARAFELWSRAAKLGHSEAQRHLGRAYQEGGGVDQSLVEAYAWYRCAIASAETMAATNSTEAKIALDARKSLTKLLQQLPSEQIAASEELAKHYIESYAKKFDI